MKKIKLRVAFFLAFIMIFSSVQGIQVQAASQKAWKRAYLKELKKDKLSDARAELLYIDGDDIPEIFVSYTVGDGEVNDIIYTYYKGKVYKKNIYNDIYCGNIVSYAKKKGYIYLNGSQASGVFDVVIKLKNGKFSYKFFGNFDEHGFDYSEVSELSKINKDFDFFSFGTLNKKETSEKKYKKDKKIALKKDKYKYKIVYIEKSIKQIKAKLK